MNFLSFFFYLEFLLERLKKEKASESEKGCIDLNVKTESMNVGCRRCRGFFNDGFSQNMCLREKYFTKNKNMI